MSPTRAKLRYQLFCEFRFFGNSRHVGLPAKLSLFSRTFNFHPTLKEKRMVSFQKNGRVKHAYFEHFLLFCVMLESWRTAGSCGSCRANLSFRSIHRYSRHPKQICAVIYCTWKREELLYFFRGMKLPLWRKVAERVAFFGKSRKKNKTQEKVHRKALRLS